MFLEKGPLGLGGADGLEPKEPGLVGLWRRHLAETRNFSPAGCKKLVGMALSIEVLLFHSKKNNLGTEEIIIMTLFKAFVSPRALYCWVLHIFAYTVH